MQYLIDPSVVVGTLSRRFIESDRFKQDILLNQDRDDRWCCVVSVDNIARVLDGVGNTEVSTFSFGFTKSIFVILLTIRYVLFDKNNVVC